MSNNKLSNKEMVQYIHARTLHDLNTPDHVKLELAEILAGDIMQEILLKSSLEDRALLKRMELVKHTDRMYLVYVYPEQEAEDE